MSNRGRAAAVLMVAVLAILTRAMQQVWRSPAGTSEPWWPYLMLAALSALVVAAMEAPPHTASVTRVLLSSVAAALVVLGAAATSQVFLPDTLPRFVVVVMAWLTFAWLMAVGTVVAVRLRRAGGSHRVIAVVTPDDADLLTRDVSEGPVERRFTLVGTMTIEEAHRGLVGRCRDEHVTTLVLDDRAAEDPLVVDHAETLHRNGVRVRSLDDFYDESIGKLPLSALDRFALMGDVESLHGAYAPLKRAIDIALSIVGGVALLALLPFVIVGNLIANRGPLLFLQERVGRNGRPFQIWKLRTMTPGALDVSGWTSNEDPRITPFGKVLRRMHVDELPQVVNIARGELSVVGPRPEQVHYARQLEEKLPFYSARHLVRPGLTGWAQVKYRYAASEEDAYVKLQYDLHYVRHESLATDLRIIWMTLHHVLTGGGR